MATTFDSTFEREQAWRETGKDAKAIDSPIPDGGVVGAACGPKPSALEQQKTAFERGDTSGCYNLGHMLSKGVGGPEDEDEAQRRYKMTCDGGLKKACR